MRASIHGVFMKDQWSRDRAIKKDIADGVCPYCSQVDTRKDGFGYCKIYGCFDASGTRQKYGVLRKRLSETWQLPTCRRNMFDGTYYNPREQEIQSIYSDINILLGFVPLEVL